MNNQKRTTLAVAIAASLGGASVADAAIISVALTNVVGYDPYNPIGPRVLDISSSTATWSYDTFQQVLAQTGGTFNARFNITPVSTVFRQSITGLVIGSGAAAAASTYRCAEGNFGATVNASVCGNYNFGANFTNESSTAWGPGIAFARTLGGDDLPVITRRGGVQESLHGGGSFGGYDGFTTVLWAGTTLVLSNATCLGGTACGTLPDGLDTGYRWTLAAVPIPAAAWLFGGALGLLGVARRRSVT